ncbi:TMAO reductase sytem sensor TorS [Tepidimonas sediminis]|uniref:TMAO reductase sytem sensor TorS n=1 Tax=Tepidimonas sediminis TaxID=2588941 RepID=A0A554WVC4_9BURK|nr:Hpt domain-containing protein [Tepidimonas sediminis]TSE27531.1 TMAO reductase sytem sensor TorS [Tepidimonas sediminis]
MTPLLDTTNLDDMLAMLGDEFRDIVRQFVDQLEPDVAGITAARAAADWDTLVRLAHTLKGSSGNMGAVALADQAARIERAARARDGAQADAALDGLQALARQTVAALRAGGYA